jgi:SAM-dependent methyltransferase
MYFSSFSDTWLAHARGFVERAVPRFALGVHSRVVEVASNDGYLLQYFVERGIPCVGVDPAMNCALTAWHERRVQTEIAFFGAETASRLLAQGGAADLIVANNVLAHVPNINDFVAGFKILLKPEGVITFEFPHLLEMIRNGQFDTIYHEHYSYLSYTALVPLFGRHGLSIVDVDRLQTHGGSLRLYVCHSGAREQMSESVSRIASEEIGAGLDRVETYRTFGANVRALKRSLLTLLIGLINDGKRIAGYGAPAKGNTLLNYCGIGTDFLAFTADRNTYKQGLLLPGTHIPIHPPDAIFSAKPDYVLILPWNLRDEIMAQLAGIREWGGKFIVPIPYPAILD